MSVDYHLGKIQVIRPNIVLLTQMMINILFGKIKQYHHRCGKMRRLDESVREQRKEHSGFCRFGRGVLVMV